MRQRTEIDEGKARELYDQGLSDQKVADALGVGRLVISRWRNETGLAPNLPARISGTRPEVTVNIPPGLKSRNEIARETAEPVLRGPVEIDFSFEGVGVSLTADDVQKARAAAEYLLSITKNLKAGTAGQ